MIILYWGGISLQTSTNSNCQFARHFQHKMNDLFHGFEFIRAYMDELFVLIKRYWTNRVRKL